MGCEKREVLSILHQLLFIIPTEMDKINHTQIYPAPIYGKHTQFLPLA